MVSGDWGLAGGRLCDADRGAVACKWPIRGMSIPTWDRPYRASKSSGGSRINLRRMFPLPVLIKRCEEPVNLRLLQIIRSRQP